MVIGCKTLLPNYFSSLLILESNLNWNIIFIRLLYNCPYRVMCQITIQWSLQKKQWGKVQGRHAVVYQITIQWGEVVMHQRVAYQTTIQLSLENKQWGEVVMQQSSISNYHQLSLQNKQWGEVVRQRSSEPD